MAVTISGSGTIDVGGTSTSQGTVRLYEDTDNGTNYVELVAPASVASNVTLTMPTTTGTVATVAGSDTQVIFNDGGSAYGGDSGLTYNKTTDTLTTSVVVHGAGTASAPSITTTGDTNTGVFFPAADTAAITTGGSERMRVDSSGNIQIATTSNPLLWYNSTTTGNRFRIEQNGTPSADAYVTQGLVRNSSEEQPAIIGFAKSRGTTAGSATIVNNNDWLGMISFQGADGTNYVEGARIDALVDGTPGANDMPTRLAFLTTADGASSPTERMRITSSGNLLVGTTTNNASGGVIQVSNGITFPATQSASSDANTLDDYEEGTWTPGVAFGGGTTGITYDSTTGNYVKIGKLVFYNFRIDMSNKGSSSGVATITGFTFTFNSSNTVGALAGVSFSSTDDLTFTANLTGAPVSGGTTLTLVRNVSGGASVDLTNTEFANGTVLRGSIVTMTAS